MGLLKLGLLPLKKYPFGFFIFSIFATLFGASGALFFHLYLNFNQVKKQVVENQVVTAFLKPGLSHTQQQQVLDEIRTEYASSIGSEESIKFVTPEEFLDRMEESDKTLAKELVDLGSELEDVVPRYLTFKGKFSDADLLKIKNYGNVEDIFSSKDKLFALAESIDVLGILLIGASIISLIGLFFVGFRVRKLVKDSSILPLQTAFLMGAPPFRVAVLKVVSLILFGLMSSGFTFSFMVLFSKPLYSRINLAMDGVRLHEIQLPYIASSAFVVFLSFAIVSLLTLTTQRVRR